MTADQLRKSILQQAIQGKLVPQDPKDEPASVLLERIREEKARLIKEKKAKREKNPSRIFRGEDNSYYEEFTATGEVRCIDDEIPFDLPESWRWKRLGEVASILGGYAFPSETLKGESGIRVVRISDFNEEGWVNKSVVRYSGPEVLSQYEILVDDLLLAMTGGTVGKSCLVRYVPERMYLNQRVAIVRPIILLPRYVHALLESSFITRLIGAIKNSTNDNISMRDIAAFLVPLPPLAEQERIVAKIEELMPWVEQYGKAQSELDQLNNSIQGRLKKSVLQYAIEGKLVPQQAEDASAEELLAEIQAEKQRLYAAGKLKKKDLAHSTIFRAEDGKYYEQVEDSIVDMTADIPFDIPEGWSWCRLKSICAIFTGATFKKEDGKTNSQGIRILRGGNILPFEITFKADDIFLPCNLVKEDILLQRNDIVTPAVTSLENIGKMARIKDDLPNVTVGGFVFVLRLYYSNDWLSKYLLALMSSPTMIEYMKSITNKSGQAFYNIGKERLATMLLPIPPHCEQQRIVSKLEEVLGVLNGLGQ